MAVPTKRGDQPLACSATSTAHAIPAARISSVPGLRGRHHADEADQHGPADERGVDHAQTGSGLPSTCSVSSHRRAAVAGLLAEA
jgi:hypothetical protein